MNIHKRPNIDFPNSWIHLGYIPLFKDCECNLDDWKFSAYINVKDYQQTTVVTANIFDERYSLIKSESILVYSTLNSENGNYSISTLSNIDSNFLSIPHNRNIYFYCNKISVDRKLAQDFFLSLGLRLIIRDNDFITNQKADFFISHDSIDKEQIVRSLVNELSELGCKVWYDEYSLKIGDSLIESINKGLSECKFGIVVLSKSFLANRGWVDYELKTLITRQISEGKS